MADVAPEITDADLVADDDLTPEVDSTASSTDLGDDGAAPVVEADDAPSFTIKVDGKEEVLTQDELIARAQMGTDYTRKSQALAEERKAVLVLEQALARDPEGTIDALRKLYGPTPTDTQDDELLDPLERKVNELTAYIEDQKRVSVEAAIDTEVARVRDTFGDPDLDEHALFAYATEHQIGNLADAYKAMKFDEVKTAAAALKEADTARQAKVEAKRSAAPVEGGAKRPEGAISDGSSDSLSVKESYLLAVKQLGLRS